jgi:hypothetical protein
MSGSSDTIWFFIYGSAEQQPNGQLDRQRKYKEARNKLNQDKGKPGPKG